MDYKPKFMTASYFNRTIKNETHLPLSISVSAPKHPLGFTVEDKLSILAPSRELLKIKDIERYTALYRDALERHGVEKIRRLLGKMVSMAGDRTVVLLCWEDVRKPGQWCHRRIFAQWWCEKTGQVIEELEYPQGCDHEPKRKEKKGSSQLLLSLF